MSDAWAARLPCLPATPLVSNAAALDHAVPVSDPNGQRVLDDTGAATEDIPTEPKLQYKSSDEISSQGSIVVSEKGAAFIAECIGFMPIEDTADSHGHSPTAVDGLHSAVQQFVKKSQKKRTSAKDKINTLHDLLTKMDLKIANLDQESKQGAKALNLKIANLEQESKIAKQGTKIANEKIANLEQGAKALEGRVKNIELDFNLRELMTRVNKKTCTHLAIKSLALGHNTTAPAAYVKGYSPNTLQHILRFFQWVQHNGNTFAHTGRPAVVALDETLKTFNEMLQKATNGPFPNNKGGEHAKLPHDAIKLIKEMADKVKKDLKKK